jgi:hypothetical protein
MMKREIAILITAVACVSCRGGMSTEETGVSAVGMANRLDAGWISLFNGRTLEGWEVKCRDRDRDKEYWKVESGSIVAHVPEGSLHNYIWLMTVGEYDDFELKLKIQTRAGDTGNSGIQVRSRYDDRAGWLDGPQIDIHPPGPWRNGFIYDETREVKEWISPITGPPRMAKPEHAPEGWKWRHADGDDLWNDVHIICRGTNIRTIINGVPVVDYDGAGRLDDEVHRVRNVGMKGHIFLQIHPGGSMNIRFRDIHLKKL